MAEQTAGLGIDELLLPEDYLQVYGDAGSPREGERNLEEIEVGGLTEETEEENSESDRGSDYDSDDDNGKGKGKAREKIKKPTKGKKTRSKKKLKPAPQVLNELVSCRDSSLRFLTHYFTGPRREYHDHRLAQRPNETLVAVEGSLDRAFDQEHQL